MKADIEQRVSTTKTEMAHSRELPQVQVDPIISPSTQKKKLCFHKGPWRANNNQRSLVENRQC
jgi:hypothetical protein